MRRKDVHHPHWSELGQDVSVEYVRVCLACGCFKLVVRKPFLQHVASECLPSTSWITNSSSCDVCFLLLPCFVGVLLTAERPRRPLLAADIDVVRGVSRLAVFADPLAREPHARRPPRSFDRRLTV